MPSGFSTTGRHKRRIRITWPRCALNSVYVYIRHTGTIAVTLKRGRKLRGKANPWNPSNDKSHPYLFLFLLHGKRRTYLARRNVTFFVDKDNPRQKCNTLSRYYSNFARTNCTKLYSYSTGFDYFPRNPCNCSLRKAQDKGWWFKIR